MKKIESNLIRSFNMVKKDLLEIQNQILDIEKRQEEINKLVGSRK